MSLIPSNFRDGVVTITDASAGPLTATLQLPAGDQALTGVKPGGAESEVYESQGHIVGLRQGKRALPQFSVSGTLAAALDSFKELAMGVTAGFVSTTAAIGDYPTVDLSWSYDYGAETRVVLAEDVAFSFDDSAGSPSSTKWTATIHGKLTIDGTDIIAAL